MVYYLQKLQPSNDNDSDDGGPRPLSTIMSARTSRVDDPQSNSNTFPPSSTTPSPQRTSSQSNHNITLLLSGYSYDAWSIDMCSKMKIECGGFSNYYCTDCSEDVALEFELDEL